jgi:exodeoxyribonuclease V alpha subunit
MIYDDPLDVRLAAAAPAGLLREFNEIGLLVAADVHVARRLTTLAGETDDAVALAVAMAVRGPRLGHVFVDLATIRDTAAVDAEEPVDLSALAWPDPDDWIARVSRSPLTAVGEGDGPADRPLRLVGSALYLDRYWREERRLAADLRAFRASPAAGIDDALLVAGLARLFDEARAEDAGPPAAVAAAAPPATAPSSPAADPPPAAAASSPPDSAAPPAAEAPTRAAAAPSPATQRDAAEAAVRRRFAVIAGGPGTGKTTTVAAIVALLAEQGGDPLIALAAPTGKAAARLEEAVHEQARKLPLDDAVRDTLLGLTASTLHRLLGWRPGSHSSFRHHRGNRLAHDVVIVDETSMVSLSLMGRLVEAVRPDARLVLVGDPGQLTSIEAGAVLGDIVGDGTAPDTIVLDRVYRHGGNIARLAAAIRAGEPEPVLDVLRSAGDDVTWIEDPGAAGALDPIRAAAVGSGRAVIAAARDGNGREALDALGAFRLLCAHRRGEYGVSTWLANIEHWLARDIDGGRWYPGRPLLITENDYALRLYNGDTGVVVATGPDTVGAAFERRGEVVTVRPTRLSAVDTVYAMTVHKSQGSQFDTVAVLLPPSTSQLLTRELLYTAVTRARRRLILAAPLETIQAAVQRPAARASGLAARLR